MASMGPRLYFFIIVVHQFDDHFGICLAVERIAMLQQFFFQLGVVLNDAVVNTHDLRFYRTRTGTAAVTGNVRMCIGLARLTMCCPARMTNAAGSFQGISIISFLDQVGQTVLLLSQPVPEFRHCELPNPPNHILCIPV